MSEQPLMRLDGFDVAWNPEAEKVKQDALEFSALIQVVRDPATNRMAHQAQATILGVIRAVETIRKELKKPIILLSRKIDSIAQDYVAALETENLRLSAMMGDYHALENAKRRAEEALRWKQLEEVEKAKAAELAKAQTLDDVDEIRERYDLKAQALAVMPPPDKPTKQIVREQWAIEIVDIWMLARMHPTCVDIRPRMIPIKEILDSGHQVAGVRAEKVPIVTARTA